jgi:hypothetical protein
VDFLVARECSAVVINLSPGACVLASIGRGLSNSSLAFNDPSSKQRYYWHLDTLDFNLIFHFAFVCRMVVW